MNPRDEQTHPITNEPSATEEPFEEKGISQARFYEFTNKIRQLKDPQAILIESLKTICEACDLPKASVSLRMHESGQPHESGE